MRMLLKVTIPVEAGNRLVHEGKLGTTIQGILGELKPEAAYFVEDDGERTAFIVVNMDEASQIPAVAEPFFLAMNARVEIHPAMTAADLSKAATSIEHAAKKYAKS